MSSPTSSPPPTIRYATEADIPTILTLIHELATYEKASSSVQATESLLLSTLSFPLDPTSPPDSLVYPRDFTPGYARTLLVIPPSTEEPVGFALFFPTYSTWLARPGIFLEDLFVKPSYRGRGYGTLLLRFLAQEVERINASIEDGKGGGRLEWNVLKWNEPSLRFYEGESVGAERMDEWVGMRVQGERVGRLSRGEGGGGAKSG